MSAIIITFHFMMISARSFLSFEILNSLVEYLFYYQTSKALISYTSNYYSSLLVACLVPRFNDVQHFQQRVWYHALTT